MQAARVGTALALAAQCDEDVRRAPPGTIDNATALRVRGTMTKALGWASSPTRLSIGPELGAYHRGAVIGNALIVLVAAVVAVIAGFVLGRKAPAHPAEKPKPKDKEEKKNDSSLADPLLAIATDNADTRAAASNTQTNANGNDEKEQHEPLTGKSAVLWRLRYGLSRVRCPSLLVLIFALLLDGMVAAAVATARHGDESVRSVDLVLLVGTVALVLGVTVFVVWTTMDMPSRAADSTGGMHFEESPDPAAAETAAGRVWLPQSVWVAHTHGQKADQRGLGSLVGKFRFPLRAFFAVDLLLTAGSAAARGFTPATASECDRAQWALVGLGVAGLLAAASWPFTAVWRNVVQAIVAALSLTGTVLAVLSADTTSASRMAAAQHTLSAAEMLLTVMVLLSFVQRVDSMRRSKELKRREKEKEKEKQQKQQQQQQNQTTSRRPNQDDDDDSSDDIDDDSRNAAAKARARRNKKDDAAAAARRGGQHRRGRNEGVLQVPERHQDGRRRRGAGGDGRRPSHEPPSGGDHDQQQQQQHNPLLNKNKDANAAAAVDNVNTPRGRNHNHNRQHGHKKQRQHQHRRQRSEDML